MRPAWVKVLLVVNVNSISRLGGSYRVGWVSICQRVTGWAVEAAVVVVVVEAAVVAVVGAVVVVVVGDVSAVMVGAAVVVVVKAPVSSERVGSVVVVGVVVVVAGVSAPGLPSAGTKSWGPSLTPVLRRMIS